MKRYILLVLACLAMSAHATTYYYVNTADLLREALSQNEYVVIELMNDIDISSFGDTRFHNDKDHPFIGIIEGNGHCLKNYHYDHEKTNIAGLITYTGQDFLNRAVIRNLRLKDFCVKGDNNVAFLATFARFTLFKNVSIEGGTFYCDDEYAGSIASEAIDCVFDGCYNKSDSGIHAGSYIGDSTVGGICGRATDTLFFRCANLNNVTCDNQYCGGIVGKMDDSSINSCIVVGNVGGHDTETGGIVGYMDDSSVRNCVYSGSVDSKDDYNCYIVGKNDTDNHISNNFYPGSSTGTNYGDLYISATSEDYKSGALAYRLNQIQGCEVWYQRIGADEYPLPMVRGQKYQVYSPVSGQYSNWNATENASIIDGVIDKNYLVLNDGTDLYIKSDFYAGMVRYIRSSPSTWSTACLPIDMTYVENLNHAVYYLSDVDLNGPDFIVKEYESGTVIPAGTPVIIKYIGERGYNGYSPSTGIEYFTSNAVIKEDIRKIDGYNNPGIMPLNQQWSMDATYVTLKDQTGMYFINSNAFWKANDPITIPAFRAWFENPYISSSVKSIGICVEENGVVTRVGSMDMEDITKSDGIYNLQGQRLSAPRRDQINIVNGKKVLTK